MERGYEIDILYSQSFGGLIQHSFDNYQELVFKRNEYLHNTKPRAGVRSGRLALVLRILKHTFLLDVFSLSNLLLYYRIRKYINTLDSHSIILHCSSPPFYLAIIAYFLKLEFGNKIFFWVDMRDLWSLHKGIPGPKIHKRLIERLVLKKCDYVTTVAHSLSRRFLSNFNCKVDIAYNVATHVKFNLSDKKFDELSKLSPSLDSKKITISYTGSLPDGYYDLDKFSLYLDEFDRQKSIYLNYQFLFVGECGEMVKRVKKLKNLAVVFLPQQKHEIVKLVQLNSEILLFFGFKAHDNQGQMSIKLFEYFETQNHVLSLFISPTSDIDNIIKLYCGQSNIISDYSSLFKILKEFIINRDVLPKMTNDKGKKMLLNDYDAITNRVTKMVES